MDINESNRVKEWNEIEDLVLTYQKQFLNGASLSQIDESQKAATELLERFNPLFKKYVTLLTTGQINFNDKESKSFVSSFIDDISLKRALSRKKQTAEYKNQIYYKFNFVKETYGSQGDKIIIGDLHLTFLTLAKRYKQVGRNFCAYIYNCYKFYISRHIKKYIKDPLNISYKKMQYEDFYKSEQVLSIEEVYEDTCYEDSIGLPDFTWISGQNCSEIFKDLSVLDRKILVKYYLEDWNDRQISETYGIHKNTINQKRRYAVKLLSDNLGIDFNEIKRNRKSGKKAIL